MSFNLTSIFRRPDYKSEATQFIDKMKADKPVLESQQRAGRELLRSEERRVGKECA